MPSNMRWRVAAFCLFVCLQFAKCHPLMKPTIMKHLRKWQDQTEIVYPRLHVTQHKRKRSLSSNSHPVLVLRTSTETFYIQLEPNNHLLQSNETVSSGHDSTDTCHYHGRLLSHIEGTAAVSICGPKNKMSGIIIVGNEAYVLRPLDHLKDEENHKNLSVEPHVLFKMEEPLSHYCGVDHKMMRQNTEENETETRRYRRSDTNGRKVIETAVYVDYPLYKKLALQRKQPLKELQDTVLAIVNEVQLIYNYQSLKTKFKIVVVKLEILSEGKEAPDAAEGNIDQYLDNFCSWQSLKNPPASSELHWDHAIMLTGFDLHKVSLKNEKNAKVLGLAWVNGMCRPKHSCTLNEGSSFEAAFVIAHEMGHSLGMLHDGHGNDCDPSAYLMSEKTGPGRITWSTCSNDYLDKFFRKGLGACLEDDNTYVLEGVDHESDGKLPGERFDLEDQCKLSLGNEFKPHVVPKSPFNDVCRELWCVSGLWASVAHPALEGSTCGSGKKCIQGKCKSMKSSSPSNEEIVDDMKSAVAEFLDKLKSAFNLLVS